MELLIPISFSSYCLPVLLVWVELQMWNLSKYFALDAWWYVEEVEREVDELFGNQNAFARCSQTTWRSDLRLLAVWICSQIMAECSTVLGKPGMSNLLGKWCRSNYLQEARWSFALPALRRQSSPPRSSGQCLYFMSWESFSFRMKVLMVLRHSDGMVWVLQVISFRRSLRRPGHFCTFCRLRHSVRGLMQLSIALPPV